VIEIKWRHEKEAREVPFTEAVETITSMVEAERAKYR
jgi:hypothetical protein